MSADPAAQSGPRRPAGPAVLLDRVEQAAGAVFLLVVLVLVSIQVVQRVTTGTSWVWTGELAKYAMVWSTFILAAHLLRIDGHLRLDILEPFLTPRGERIMTRVTDILIAVTCLGLVWAAWGLVNAPFLGTSPAAGIPLTIVYAVPLAGLALMTVTAVWYSIRGRRPKPATDQNAAVPDGGF